jgi:pimeloyl-ACP methyl ester carboxylesterase
LEVQFVPSLSCFVAPQATARKPSATFAAVSLPYLISDRAITKESFMKRIPIFETKILAGLAACGAMLLLGGCGQQTQDPVLALDECILQGGMEVRCGTLTVPENPADPNGKKIELEYVIRPAKVRNKAADPVVIFAGGPGQAASEAAEGIMGVFDKVNNQRDIVFLDQRGTGEKSMFECDDVEEEEMLADPLLAIAKSTFDGKRLQDCLKHVKADGRFYGTTTAMQDLEALRKKLGYEKLNLWGASYGTRAALEYLKRYESNVRSVVLDGVAPADMRLSVSMTRDAGALFDRLLAECAADKACNTAYPDLANRTQQILNKLASGSMPVTLIHPITGEQKTYELNDTALRAALFRPLYIPQLQSLLPSLIDSAAKGNFAPLLTANLAMTTGGLSGINFGMHLAIVCGEDVKPITEADRKTGGALFTPAFTKMYDESCKVWPTADVPADFWQPVKSNVPVMILSGGRDPVTPPTYGDQVAKTLPNSKHFIATNIGHGVSQHACAPRMIREFIAAATFGKEDGECLKRMPAPPPLLPMTVAKAATTEGAGK